MLGSELHRIAFELLKIIRELGAMSVEDDLTFQHMRMLMAITHGKSQTEMAEAFLVSPAAISKMIDGLVQRELVTRKPDEDRRRQVLTLTPSGKKIYNKFIKAVDGKMDKKILLLPADEQKQLEQGLIVLEKVVTMMREVKMLVFLLPFFAFTNVHAAITLKDAFESARKNMETLKRADATVERSEQMRDRARGSILPTVAGVGTYTQIDAPDLAGGPSPFLLTRQYSYALRLIQPLLRGGSLAALSMAKENILLAELQKTSSELTLAQLVINSYYSLVIARFDSLNLLELKRLSAERVKDLKSRASIGRSRRGELVEAEAQLLTSDSQAQQGVINLAEAEKNFEFFTGMKAADLPPLSDLPMVDGSLQNYLNKIKARADIMASHQQIRVAEKQIDVAKGGHYPSLDFTGNYYFKRTGVLATSDWDAGLALNFPLYQGGTINAQVKDAVAAKRIAELTTSETTRAAERDLAVIYQNYLQLSQQLTTLKNAREKAEEAYNYSRRDYSNGLVTNLQVLQSLNLFINAKRSYDTASAMALMSYHNLQAASGVLP